jgi:hypothetical protein
MPKLIAATLAALTLMTAVAESLAHTIPWRGSETRHVGFGTCAKGPCIRRGSWAASKPHHHHGSQVVYNTTGSHSRCKNVSVN